MEVDYICAYNWLLKDGKVLPGPDFEGAAGIESWEGEVIVEVGAEYRWSKGLVQDT